MSAAPPGHVASGRAARYAPRVTSETIGPYRVVRELGRGGMGVVYEAEDPRLGRRVALKLLPRGVLDPELLLRFGREAAALARVEHPNVLPVHGLEETERGPCLVTALIAGEPLDARLARGPLEPAQARALVGALADALTAVHAADLLHRDLKPSNVLVRADGTPVLLDFGLARELDARTLTQTGTLLGTPAYMAPEQARGVSPRLLDARVDVYGLGALLFACLAGRAPFAGPSPYAVLQQVVEREPAWPAHSPPDLVAVGRRALAKEPAERYASAAELGAALARPAAPRGRARAMAVGLTALAALAALALHGIAGPSATPGASETSASPPARGRASAPEGAAGATPRAPVLSPPRLSADAAPALGSPTTLRIASPPPERWQGVALAWVDDERLAVVSRGPGPQVQLWTIDRQPRAPGTWRFETGSSVVGFGLLDADGRTWALLADTDRGLVAIDLERPDTEPRILREGFYDALAVAPDRRRYAAHEQDGALLLFEGLDADPLEVATFERERVRALTFDPSGAWLAGAVEPLVPDEPRGQAAPRVDGAWFVLDTRRPAAVRRGVDRGANLRALALTDDGAALLGGTAINSVERLTLGGRTPFAADDDHGGLLMPGSGHSDAVEALLVAGDLLLSAAGGVGGEVRAWDLRGDRSLGVLRRRAQGGYHAIALSPTARRLALGCGDGHVEVYELLPAAR